MKLRAPYNFVPLSPNGVFHPDWAEVISLDMPFEDGLSGVIEVKLTAKSPIFVRNGLSKISVTTDDRKSITPNYYNRFNHIVDGNGNMRYFIPGSSVKGLLRSTVEIISNGKFAQVENQSFGKRDPGNKNYREIMQNCSCGWMYLDENGGWQIDDHGKAIKVNVALLSDVIPDLMGHIKDHDALKKDKNKTSLVKYRMLLGKDQDFKHLDFYEDFISEKLNICYKMGKITTSKGKKVDAVVSVNGDSDECKGIIVLTGQQGAFAHDDCKKKKCVENGKIYNPGKHHEFIFPLEYKAKGLLVSSKVVEAFKTIHVNSDDWTELWADQLLIRNQKVPVFFCKDPEGNVTSIGLASMYKYPYAKSVWNAVPTGFRDDAPDLAECMFGYVGKDNSDALKGRVHVGHFFVAENKTHECPEVHKLILGTPHPSYYPLYVQGGKTWDEAVEVNGRKFYPVRKSDTVPLLPDDDNPAVTEDGRLVESAVAMCPLATDTEFTGKVRFFNLRPFELGALVSALTLFNDKDRYHSIGMGKPLGYGKTSVAVDGIYVYKNSNPTERTGMKVEDCIGMFTNGTCGYDFAEWKESEVNVEFEAMTRENNDIDSYMVMTTDARTDEFRLMKSSRGLPRFTRRTKGDECENLTPGRHIGEIVSSQSVTDRGTGKKTWKYGVSLVAYPDVILTAVNVPVPFAIGQRVSVNVVKDCHSGAYIRGVFKSE